jgi:membrane protein DedA with SNARE-associated domain
VEQHGYPAIVLLLMFGIVGLPVPDETLLTFAGYLAYKHHLAFVPALAAAITGSVCGITASYALGRVFGMPLVHRLGRYIHVDEESIHKAHAWFERFGGWALTFGYYIPGVRHFTAYAAGISQLEPHFFALFAYTGAVIWSSTFILLGYLLGERWEEATRLVRRHVFMAAVAAAVMAAAYLLFRKMRARKS